MSGASRLRDRVASRTGPSQRAQEWTWLFGSVVAALAVAVLAPFGPDRTTVSIENPTEQILYIDASTPTSDTRTPVAVVSPTTAATVEGVIDRGGAWILHVHTGSGHVGDVAVARAELVESPFALPPDLVARIESAD